MWTSEFKNSKEKLHYVMQELGIVNREISQKTDLRANIVSDILNPNNSSRTIQRYHIYAILLAFDIPKIIFDNEHMKKTEIIKILKKKNQNTNSQKELKKDNQEKLQTLVGEWYLYSYSNNISTHRQLYSELSQSKNVSYINVEKIKIDNDFRVKNDSNSIGKVHINTNQSTIILEETTSKDTILYTFDNNRVHYKRFLFSKFSKMSISNREILKFGFFSKNEVQEKDIILILNEAEKTQLKVDFNFLDRISSFNEMEDY